MRLGLFGILSVVTAFCACTQSSPASSDDDSISLNGPHNTKFSSSSKKLQKALRAARLKFRTKNVSVRLANLGMERLRRILLVAQELNSVRTSF